MKKSNALMLSYMIFLVISIIAQIFFPWNGLDQIAMAATIAGVFFAFADLAGWYVSNQTNIENSLKETDEHIEEIYSIIIETIDMETQECSKILELIKPYREHNEHFKELSRLLQDLLETNVQRKQEAKAKLIQCQNNEGNFDKAKKKIDRMQVSEILLVILGFVTFFMMISFPYLVELLINYQSFATVIAFLVIMFTYYLRDVIEEKYKRDLEELLDLAEKKKLEAKKQYDDALQRGWLKKIKLFITDNEEIKSLEASTTEDSK